MSAIAIGKWLVELDLRGSDKQPTSRAISEGFCRLTPLKDGTPFYLWNAEKVSALLKESGAVQLNRAEQEAYDIARSLVGLESNHPDEDKVWCLLVEGIPPKLYPLVNRFLEQSGSSTRLSSGNGQASPVNGPTRIAELHG
jgi:hypothetical protein